jgi:hypothetical protein
VKTTRGNRGLYLGIAETMRSAKPPRERDGNPDAELDQWEQDCQALAAFFAAGSSAFDKALFLRNCGIDNA